MKNRIFIIAILASAMFLGVSQKSEAQITLGNQTVSLRNSSSLTRDTVTNTAAHVMSYQVKGAQKSITIQVDVTKITGTLAGTIVPVGSNDGVTFYVITDAYGAAASYTVTDVSTQGKCFNIPTGYPYVGVLWTGSGTMSGSFTAKLFSRKQP